MRHELRTDACSFDAMQAGDKTAELRRDDRGFAVGDALRLMRQDEHRQYTGEIMLVMITHIMRGPETVRYGLREGFALLSVTQV